MRPRRARLIGAVATIALVAAGCGSSTSGGDSGGDGLSGAVRVDGSSTVGPLSEVAAELYMLEEPGVRVTVAISGTSGGFQKFCAGETDANNSSRLIKDSEIEECEANGIRYDFVQVANDALSLVVNATLPVECMTVEQASQIWDAGSTVRIWGDIDGLDLPADVASQEITVYGPGTDSGTFDYFTEAINGETGRIRTNYVDIGEDDLAAVVAVEGDPYAMGYIPFSYYQEAGEAVKALAIDAGNGCVEATAENVQNGSYTPLGRGLFVYLSDTALSRPEVLDFAEFYVENAARIAELAGFVAMTPEQLEEQRVKIAALSSGG